MSTNYFSSDISDTLWWTNQQHQPILMEHPPTSSSAPPNPSSGYHPVYPATHRFNLNQNDEDDDDDDTDNVRPLLEDQTMTTEIPTSHERADEEAKERMFEKPLTPSDVGKLNRLVIPKQHAEKYFPLGGESAESKGLLLSFEDETGKCWRFRYSYWNSSQSYVLTKGWSRYVKEKRLDAGDVVLFERHRADAQRLFIGWRRRQVSGSTPAQVSRPVIADGSSNSNNGSNGMGVGVGVGVGWTRGFYPAHPYPAHHQPLPYQPSADCLHAGRGGTIAQSQTAAPVENGSRVLRLFGVNMEWQPENSGPSSPESSHLSSRHVSATHQVYRHQPPYSPNLRNHMVPPSTSLPIWASQIYKKEKEKNPDPETKKIRKKVEVRKNP